MSKYFLFLILLGILSSCSINKVDSPSSFEFSFPSISIAYPQNNAIVGTNFEVYGTISSLSGIKAIYLIANSSNYEVNIYNFQDYFHWEKELILDPGNYEIRYFMQSTSGKYSETNSIGIIVSNIPTLTISSPSNGSKFNTNYVNVIGIINSSEACDLKLIINSTNTNEIKNIYSNFQQSIAIEKARNILDFELFYNGSIVSRKRRIFTGPSIDAFEMAKKLGKGVNMGNALEAYPDESSWGNPIKDEYFTLMKQAGFDTVRIPIRWSTRAQAVSPYTISSDFFARVDHVVNVALSAGLNVIINIHHYEEIISNPQTHKERFLALWRQISEHYRNMPENLLFEVLNEPYGSLEPYWTDFMTNAIKIIREKNPTRNIIIGGINWNSIDGLTNLYLPQNDPYIIATFHFYEPFVFTHQGAEWVGGMSKVSNIIWPGPPPTPVKIPPGLDSWISNWLVDYNTKQGDQNPASSNQIILRLDIVSNWAAQKKIPVWLGEFGVYGKYADMNSRVRWTHFVRTECEKRNISWCYWEFSAGFGIYNPSTGQWVSQLSNALLGK